MRKTCAHCPHLRFEPPPHDGAAFASCALRGKDGERVAIPQRTRLMAPGQWKSVFWRISVHCPLPNHIVEKRAAPGPTFADALPMIEKQGEFRLWVRAAG